MPRKTLSDFILSMNRFLAKYVSTPFKTEEAQAVIIVAIRENDTHTLYLTRKPSDIANAATALAKGLLDEMDTPEDKIYAANMLARHILELAKD